MLAGISSRQLFEWFAFSSLEPFGYKASLHGSAMVTAMIYNANRKPTAQEKSPADFIPKEDEGITDPDEIFDAFKSLAQRPKNERSKTTGQPRH
jgi:hypothetical protein